MVILTKFDLNAESEGSFEHGLACLVLREFRRDLFQAGLLLQTPSNHILRLERTIFLVAEILLDLAGHHPGQPVPLAFRGQAKFFAPTSRRLLKLPTIAQALRTACRQLGWLEIDPGCSTGLRLCPAGEEAAENVLEALAGWMPANQVLPAIERVVRKHRLADPVALSVSARRCAGQRIVREGEQARFAFVGPELAPYLDQLRHLRHFRIAAKI